MQYYLSIIKDIVTIIATIIGSCVAIYGLISWRKQLKGRTEYDLARRVLKAVYKVREAIQSVRDPFQSASEVEMAIKETCNSIEENSPDYRIKSTTSVYQIRWNRLNRALLELKFELLEAEVSWGRNVHNKINPLNECIGKLCSTINLHLHSLQNNYHETSQRDAENINSRLKILYTVSDDPNKDDFLNQINLAVIEVEEFLKPYLKL